MAVSPLDFYTALVRRNIDFFTGVPDSLLKDFCLCIDENVSKENHIIAANEGNAIATAAGYHLGTGKLPLVYMQNSGLGNALNPLLSLCDREIYSIPMILLVGWRGEPGVPDAIQHVKDGRIQLDLLDVVEIPYEIVSGDQTDIQEKVHGGIEKASKESQPFVFLVKKGSFATYETKPAAGDAGRMLREEALQIILERLEGNSVIVSTTGKTSREVFEIRDRKGQSHSSDFLTVGSMGHCSSIALGVAIARSERDVVCIDGDGALIMHLGSLATIGKAGPKNFKHILINNRVHESVGSQPTAVDSMNVPELVRSTGYEHVYSVEGKDELVALFDEFSQQEGPSFLEVKVRPGSREDLGRPAIPPTDNKKAFQEFLGTQ